MGSRWILPIGLVGTVLLFISRHAQAFVASGGPSLVNAATRLRGPGRGLISVQRNKITKALCVLDDYQQNPDGLAEGDVVKVIDAGLKFYHIMKFKKEGLKPEGAVGEIKMLKLESKKYPGELWTANRPVFVQFMKPVKYKAHFEFEELRKATDEEKKQYEQEEAEVEAEAAAAAAARAEARAAKEAEAAKSG